jgi:hypothetical protein
MSNLSSVIKSIQDVMFESPALVGTIVGLEVVE